MMSPEEQRFQERGISGRGEVIDDLLTIIEGFPTVPAAAGALGLGVSTLHAIKTGNATISAQALHALYGPRGNALQIPKGFDAAADAVKAAAPDQSVSPAPPPQPPAEPEAATPPPPATVPASPGRACAELAAPAREAVSTPLPAADKAALAAKLLPILTNPIAAVIDTLRDHRELAASRLAEAQVAFEAACAVRNDADEAVTKIDCAIEVLEGLAA